MLLLLIADGGRRGRAEEIFFGQAERTGYDRQRLSESVELRTAALASVDMRPHFGYFLDGSKPKGNAGSKYL